MHRMETTNTPAPLFRVFLFGEFLIERMVAALGSEEADASLTSSKLRSTNRNRIQITRISWSVSAPAAIVARVQTGHLPKHTSSLSRRLFVNTGAARGSLGRYSWVKTLMRFPGLPNELLWKSSPPTA
jgi:hypothetical protein